MRFPAVKIFEKGVERRDITYFMKVNNRTPTFIGDLRAQIGAAQLGVRRLKEVIARHGVDGGARRASQYMIDYAARRFREEVRALGATASTSRTSTSTTIRRATRTSTSTAR